MNKPTGDEPPSLASKSMSQQPSRQQELFTLPATVDAAVFDAAKAQTKAMLEHALVAHHRRAAERAAREAAREAEIAQLQSEIAKLRAANQHIQKENDSLREEVLHHRHALGYYEEENAELRARLEMPKAVSRLDYN